MSLVPYTITTLERDVADADASGKNIIVGATCSMFIQPANTAVIMYDDAAGSNGSTAKVSGANGQVIVFVEPGDYLVSANASPGERVEVGQAALRADLADNTFSFTNTGWYDLGAIGSSETLSSVYKDFRLSERTIGIANAITLNGDTNIRNLKLTPTVSVSNPVRMEGSDNVVDGLEYISDLGVTRFANHVLINDAIRSTIKNCLFKHGTYQVIQNTGTFANSVRVFDNVAVDNTNDFVLANNDFDAGVSYDWSVMGNIVDMTNNGQDFDRSESRGIGFTSVYGARAINNSMISCKGDSATHLENTQETQIAFNYYRNNLRDVLFSGLRDREQIQLNTISGGSVEVFDVITSTTSGGTGTIQFYDSSSRIAQVINIVGIFLAEDTYTIDGKSTTGVIRKPDPVQAHANIIGNIFHKTTLDTTNSVQIGGNSYRLRNLFMGNIYAAATAYGGNTTAFAASFGYESKLVGETFRGWSDAIQGNTTIGLDVSNSHFWNNANNFRFDAYSDSLIHNNNFVDGDFSITTAENMTFSHNHFKDGVVTIGGNIGNKWLHNRVEPECDISALGTDDFDFWESSNYTKKEQEHQIRDTRNLSGVSQTLATLQPKTGNCSCVVEFKHSLRSPTSGGRSFSEAGRAMITWNNSSIPTVTLDTGNFNAGNAIAEILLVISGTDVAVTIDNQAPTFNIISTSTLNITTEQVNVTPNVDLKS
jgi:hypothetical protein